MFKNKGKKLLTGIILGGFITATAIAGSAFAENNNDQLKRSLDKIFGSNAKNPVSQVAKFNDMKGNWSAGVVGQLVTLGSVGGYEDNTFKPNKTITRAEFSKILSVSLLLDQGGAIAFNDTKDHWASANINTLVDSQIIDKNEYGKNYNPNTEIARLEIAKMMVRAIGLNDQAIEKAGQSTGFADNLDVKAKDRGYVIVAKELGLIGGYNDGTFKPNNKATRAEASAMIIRTLQYIYTGQALPKEDLPEQPKTEVDKQLQKRGEIEKRLPSGVKSVAKHENPQTQRELVENLETMPISDFKDSNAAMVEVDQVIVDYLGSFPKATKPLAVVKSEFNYNYTLGKSEYEGVKYTRIISKEMDNDKLLGGVVIKDGDLIGYIGKVGGSAYSIPEDIVNKGDYFGFGTYDGKLVVIENPFKK